MNRWLLPGIVVAVVIVAIVIIASISSCPADLKLCPDGSYVARSGLNCEFEQCPEPVACTGEAKVCPDGSTVGRNPALNCEFDLCQDETDCGEEGETIGMASQPGLSPRCCTGLEAILPKEQNIGEPLILCTAKCGNGTCDEIESSYNCPEDCGGEPEIWNIGIEPDGVPPHYLNQVTFTVLVTGITGLDSLRLVESDSGGNILREIGELKDDGKNTDIIAGDLVYSGSFEIASAEEGKQYYIAQTEVDAYPVVYASEPAALAITSFPIGPASSDPDFLVMDAETGMKLYSNELLVGFKASASDERIREIVEAENASVTGTILSLGVYTLQIEGDGTAEGVKTAAEAFEAYEEVEYAEPNHAVELD